MKEDGNSAAHGDRVQRANVDSVEKDSPSIGIVEAAEQLDERTFPGAVVAYESNDFALGYLEVEAVQGGVETARIGEADALEANGFLDRKARFACWAGKNCWLQGQEFVKIFNEEQAAVDFSRSFEKGAQQNLGLLEGLKAEQEIAQPRPSGESPL